LGIRARSNETSGDYQHDYQRHFHSELYPQRRAPNAGLQLRRAISIQANGKKLL
jgi:hypothetical protein